MSSEYEISLKQMIEYERTMANDVEDYWNEKESEFEEVEESDWETFLRTAAWGAGLSFLLQPNIVNTFMNGVEREFNRAGTTFLGNEKITEAFIAQRSSLLRESGDRVVRQMIDDILSNQYTVGELKERFGNYFNVNKNKAALIAQTESTAAFNSGRLEGAKELNYEYKQWLHSGDSNVRPSHRISQIVRVEEYFTLNNGVKLQYPGDSSAGAGETCNCRCSLIAKKSKN